MLLVGSLSIKLAQPIEETSGFISVTGSKKMYKVAPICSADDVPMTVPPSFYLLSLKCLRQSLLLVGPPLRGGSINAVGWELVNQASPTNRIESWYHFSSRK